MEVVAAFISGLVTGWVLCDMILLRSERKKNEEEMEKMKKIYQDMAKRGDL